MIKVDFDKLADELLATGMAKVRVKEMIKQIKQDMIDWPEMYESGGGYEEALKMGFIPGHVKLFEAFDDPMREENRDCFYRDFDYFMSHPMNNHFAFWINDKLTLKYMLNAPGFRQYMPEYYLYIENDGHYSYLMDVPDDIPKDENFLYNLLVEKKQLAMKPNHGSGGKGFLGLALRDGEITVNGKRIDKNEFEELKTQLNGYIVTEFIKQTEDLDRIFPGTDCALRFILYKKVQKRYTDDAEYGCLISYARFGSERSNGASNLCHGGLAVRVDWETGEFKGNFRGNGEFWGHSGVRGFREHPDTGKPIDGERIPHWEKIRKGLFDICRYLSSLDLFGMDVIVTDDGFMLCEINSAPSTGLGQFHQGKCCLDNEDARAYAESKKRPYKKSFYDCFMAATEA